MAPPPVQAPGHLGPAAPPRARPPGAVRPARRRPGARPRPRQHTARRRRGLQAPRLRRAPVVRPPDYAPRVEGRRPAPAPQRLVWTVSSGFCFITFSEHTNAVTAVHFMADNYSLLSASLDGTIRAWDLFRYRNFRTFTTPSPRQFVSLTADQSGEVICAATLDSFEIFGWSMKTGWLLDVLSGHEGPVHSLMFRPINAIMASSSWDKTVRLWDVFESKGAVETFQHSHDVLTLAHRPDRRQIACSTLDGLIHFWDPSDGLLMCTIEDRRDIAGGRLMTDR